MKKTILCALCALLAACDNSSVRSTLGLSRRAPDEFRVVSRPPLSVPPDFNLRPPAAPGEKGQGLVTPASTEAKTLVMGTDGTAGALQPGAAETAVQPVTTNALESPADAQFLHHAGADRADARIREQLAAEKEAAAPENRSYLESLRHPSGENEPVVNAAPEAARIQEDKARGQPVTAGDTPTVSPKDTGPLGRLLGY
ncbi:MAG: DUF3035 domain-containing protein [Alphaproteobacteria bacterium]|nr:DUF3035 domain-containing protein [Alphaproteobacteria bacterium]